MTWMNHLNTDPQDYAVSCRSNRGWMGIAWRRGSFASSWRCRWGDGYTVEEQLTGEAEHGGLQLIAYPMKAERYEEMLAKQSAAAPPDEFVAYSPIDSASMGLAPGGRMRQEIYDDDYGLDAWDQRHASRCFVTIANSVQWMALTGERPPTEAPTTSAYASAGLPWFDYFGGDLTAIAETDKLRGIASVAEIGAANGESPLPENESADVDRVISLRRPGSNQVREMYADAPTTS